jgi:hypothetical protein
MFRRYTDGMLLHCVNNEEAHKLLQETHGSSNYVIHVGGHIFLKPLLLRLSGKGIIGLQSFVILMFFRDLVTRARNLLGKNVFLLCLYNLSSQTFLFQNGVWNLLVILILRIQQDKSLS